MINIWQDQKWRTLLYFVLFVHITIPCIAQVTIVRETVEQVIKRIGSRLGSEAAEEVIQKFGKEGMEVLLEKALKEGGEEGMKRTAKVVGEYGLQALRILKDSPMVIVKALDDLPADLVKPALGALERNSELMIPLVTKYGGKALQLELSHPGVGGKVLSSLGDDAIDIGRRLSTDEMIKLSRHVDDIAKLPAVDRSALLAAMKKTPTRILDELEKHPKVLYTSAGLIAVIASKDSLLGKGGTKKNKNSDGSETEEPNGIVDRALDRLLKQFERPLAYILLGVGVIIMLWIAQSVWSSYQRNRLKTELERVKVEAEVKKIAESQQVPQDKCE